MKKWGLKMIDADGHFAKKSGTKNCNAVGTKRDVQMIHAQMFHTMNSQSMLMFMPSVAVL